MRDETKRPSSGELEALRRQVAELEAHVAQSTTRLAETGERFRDITERKRADEALWASEFRYRSLFENMLDGYAYCKIILDENDKPVDFVYIEIMTHLRD